MEGTGSPGENFRGRVREKAPGRRQPPETPKVRGKGRAKNYKTLRTAQELSNSSLLTSNGTRAATTKKIHMTIP